MIAMLEYLKSRVLEQDRQLIDDLLAQIVDDTSEAASSLSLSHTFHDDTQGESDISAEVGSNGDILDEDVLQTETSRATGFVGKASEVRWLRGLQHVTEHPEEATHHFEGPYGPPGDSARAAQQRTEAWTQRQRQDSSVKAHTSASNFYLDSDDTEINGMVNPFELPAQDTAQMLLDGYMATVQHSFPIFIETVFRRQLDQHYTSMLQGMPSTASHRWLTILNLVFAIGAKYLQLTEIGSEPGSENHHIYWSRAHMLGLDGSSLVVHPDLMQIQITALVAFYFLCIGRVNRAWIIIGTSLRYAHALGLHVRNEDRTVTISKKETLLRIWWSLYSIDGIISTIVGRPSFVIQDFCSVPLPLPLTTLQLSDEALVHQFHEQYRGGSSLGDHSQAASRADEPPNAGSFLTAHVQASLITQHAMAELYSEKVATKSWKQAQQAVTALCSRLEAWLTSLPSELNFSQPSSDISLQRERSILQMQYIGIKILVTRPCLCRLDRRMTNQSKTSDSFNQQTAQVCVGAAVAMADLLPEEVNTTYLYQIGPWWSIVHNIMQALIVLLLEMSYDTAHLPYEWIQILPPTKKLIRWLRTMSNCNHIAERAYKMTFVVLRRLASKFNIDISELILEDITRTKNPAASHSEVQESTVGPYWQEHIVSPTEQVQAMGDQARIASASYEIQPSWASMFEVPVVQPQDSLWTVESADPEETLLSSANRSTLMFGNPFASTHDQDNPVTTSEDLFGINTPNSWL